LHVEPKLAQLKARLKLDERGISKLVKTKRQVLSCNIKQNLEAKLDWLKMRFELDDEDICKLVKTKPAALGCGMEQNLEPKSEWLQKRLALNDGSLSDVVQRMPSMLAGLNIETNMEPTIKFYEECLGSDAATTFVANSPRVLNSSLKKGSSQDSRNVRKLTFPLTQAQ
jgi:hypothetical protein